MIDLSIATIDDIVEELQRRRIVFALYVSHLKAGSYWPGGDVPSEVREKVYGDTFASKNPLFLASQFCDGVQQALNDVVGGGGRAVSKCVELSSQTHALQKQLHELWKLEFPEREAGGSEPK
jgi:hypothetical protein